MIIICPCCNSRYIVDSEAIYPQERTVKCTKCCHLWSEYTASEQQKQDNLVDERSITSSAKSKTIAILENVQKVQESKIPNPRNDETHSAKIGVESPPKDPLLSQHGSLTAQPKPPVLLQQSRRWPARRRWLFLFLVLGVAIGGTISFKNKITAIWPNTAKLYEILGITEIGPKISLSVRNLRYNYLSHDVLQIHGELENLSNLTHDTPSLGVIFMDGSGVVVLNRKLSLPQTLVLPYQIIKFSTEILNPPTNAKRLEVGFNNTTDENSNP